MSAEKTPGSGEDPARGIDLRRLEAEARSRGVALPPEVAAWLIARALEALGTSPEAPDVGRGSADDPRRPHGRLCLSAVRVSWDGSVALDPAPAGDLEVREVPALGARRPEVDAAGSTAPARPGRPPAWSTEAPEEALFYASPEAARGASVDARSDIFSLGACLYALLTGSPPFEGPTDHALRKAITDAPPPPLSVLRPDVPTALLQAVERALQKHPEDRYPDTAAFQSELDAALAGWKGSVDRPSVTAYVRAVREGQASPLGEEAGPVPHPAGTLGLPGPDPYLEFVPTRVPTEPTRIGPPPLPPSLLAARRSSGWRTRGPLRLRTSATLAVVAATALVGGGIAFSRWSPEPAAEEGTPSADRSLGRSAGPSLGGSADPSLGGSADPSLGGSADPSLGGSADPSVGRSADPGGSTDSSAGRAADPSGSTDSSAGRSANPSVGRSADETRGPLDGPSTLGPSPETSRSNGTGRTPAKGQPLPDPDAPRGAPPSGGIDAGARGSRTEGSPSERLLGALVILTEPAGLPVWVDGREVGRSPVELDLPPGRHRVVLADRSMGLFRRWSVDLGPGERIERSAIVRTGRLSVRARPRAAVYLDGHRVGRTPLELEVIEGKHRLELVSRSGRRRGTVVFVRAGETETVRMKLGA